MSSKPLNSSKGDSFKPNSGIPDTGIYQDTDKLSSYAIDRSILPEYDKPKSLILSGIDLEQIEQLLADTGLNINPNALSSICRSILNFENLEPQLIKLCISNTENFSASQKRTFKARTGKFIDLHCGVNFEHAGYLVSIDKDPTKEKKLSVTIGFPQVNAEEAWESVASILDNYFKISLQEEIYFNSSSNTIWDGGNAHFLISDDIFLTTSPLDNEKNKRTCDILQHNNFDLLWLPQEIQFTQLSNQQLEKIFEIFNCSELSALQKSGFIAESMQSMSNSLAFQISKLWPLNNPLQFLTTFEITRLLKIAENKTIASSDQANYPYELKISSFDSDLGEILVAIKPRSCKSLNTLLVDEDQHTPFSEDTVIISISWDAMNMSEEQTYSAWEIVDELSRVFDVKNAKSKLSEIILQRDMPQLKELESDIGSHMRLSLVNRQY